MDYLCRSILGKRWEGKKTPNRHSFAGPAHVALPGGAGFWWWQSQTSPGTRALPPEPDYLRATHRPWLLELERVRPACRYAVSYGPCQTSIYQGMGGRNSSVFRRRSPCSPCAHSWIWRCVIPPCRVSGSRQQLVHQPGSSGSSSVGKLAWRPGTVPTATPGLHLHTPLHSRSIVALSKTAAKTRLEGKAAWGP